MPLKNTRERYGIVTKLLHWSIAVLIIGLTALGVYMMDLTYYDRYYNVSLETHKALGILVLELAILKILWSGFSPSPESAPSMKRWEKGAAKLMHFTLYAMMVLIPSVVTRSPPPTARPSRFSVGTRCQRGYLS